MNHATHVARAFALALLAAVGVALGAAAAEQPALTGVVNVNTATLEELQLLPGVGEARALISLRKERGGFKSIEQLVEIKGIGQIGLERMRRFVRLTGKTTAQIK